MNKTANILVAAGMAFGASGVVTAGPALAQDRVALSANVGLVSDYRFRGVSRSGEDPAIQGGFDASLGNFYVGTWASSSSQFAGAEAEVDLYGGWATRFNNGMSFDVGFLYYGYPGANNADYFEIYSSVGGSQRYFDWTVGANYAPDSDNTTEDNIYIYGDLRHNIANSPLYVEGGLGWEDGHFANNKIDWKARLGVTYQTWDIFVSYVDSDKTDAAVVFGVGAAF